MWTVVAGTCPWKSLGLKVRCMVLVLILIVSVRNSYTMRLMIVILMSIANGGRFRSVVIVSVRNVVLLAVSSTMWFDRVR